MFRNRRVAVLLVVALSSISARAEVAWDKADPMKGVMASIKEASRSMGPIAGAPAVEPPATYSSELPADKPPLEEDEPPLVSSVRRHHGPARVFAAPHAQAAFGVPRRLDAWTARDVAMPTVAAPIRFEVVMPALPFVVANAATTIRQWFVNGFAPYH